MLGNFSFFLLLNTLRNRENTKLNIFKKYLTKEVIFKSDSIFLRPIFLLCIQNKNKVIVSYYLLKYINNQRVAYFSNEKFITKQI